VTFTESRDHAKTRFDSAEDGATFRVPRNRKPIADISLVMANLPSSKRRRFQQLIGEIGPVGSLILEERGSGA